MVDVQKIWKDGDEIDNWACDVNPETDEIESNGGVEHFVYYKGRYYLIITTWDDKIVSDKCYTEVIPNSLEDDDYLKKLIEKHEIEIKNT